MSGSSLSNRAPQKITVFVPNDDCLNFTEENYVLFAVFGYKGHAIGDISVVCFKVVKVPLSLFWLYTKARRKEQDHKF